MHSLVDDSTLLVIVPDLGSLAETFRDPRSVIQYPYRAAKSLDRPGPHVRPAGTGLSSRHAGAATVARMSAGSR